MLISFDSCHKKILLESLTIPLALSKKHNITLHSFVVKIKKNKQTNKKTSCQLGAVIRVQGGSLKLRKKNESWHIRASCPSPFCSKILITSLLSAFQSLKIHLLKRLPLVVSVNSTLSPTMQYQPLLSVNTAEVTLIALTFSGGFPSRKLVSNFPSHLTEILNIKKPVCLFCLCLVWYLGTFT